MGAIQTRPAPHIRRAGVLGVLHCHPSRVASSLGRSLPKLRRKKVPVGGVDDLDLFDQFDGVDLDTLGDALQRVTAAADNRTTVPSPTA
jgi:hypothetical protein